MDPSRFEIPLTPEEQERARQLREEFEQRPRRYAILSDEKPTPPAPISLKVSAETAERLARLVKKTKINRHNILLRLVNYGLAAAEADPRILLSEDALSNDEQG